MKTLALIFFIIPHLALAILNPKSSIKSTRSFSPQLIETPRKLALVSLPGAEDRSIQILKLSNEISQIKEKMQLIDGKIKRQC